MHKMEMTGNLTSWIARKLFRYNTDLSLLVKLHYENPKLAVIFYKILAASPLASGALPQEV